MPERLYSAYQIADLLGTDPASVVDWMRKGWLPYRRMPDGPLRVSETGLIEFLKGRGMNVEEVLAKAVLTEGDSPGDQAPAANEPHAPVDVPARPALAAPDAPGDELISPDERSALTGAGNPHPPADDDRPQPEPTAEAPEPAPPQPQAEDPPDEYPGPPSEAAQFLLREAVLLGATQIHLSTRPAGVRVRLRIDGSLQENSDVQSRLAAGQLISQLKDLAGIDRTGPAAGLFQLTIDERPVAFRLVLCPSIHGETLTIHVRDPRAATEIASLPLTDPQRQLLESIAAAPDGLILVAGPPRHGGKAVLRALAGPHEGPTESVVAIGRSADPLFEGVDQSQFDRNSGLTFAAALHALADLEPDVIVAGDLPNPPATLAALDAACGGDLVLAAMNVPTAADAIQRLLQVAPDRWELAGALRAILAVRTVPALCEHCKTQVPPNELSLPREGLAGDGMDFPIFRKRGCARCDQSGYRGRAVLLSVLRVDRTVADAIRSGAAAEAIVDAARAAGTQSLAEAVLERLRDGRIDLVQAARVLAY